ncbi:MAG: hypothetical protein KAQ64_03695 [Candidatus Pacebacteria bacterium]|nr:hypothetical protein [Candidatus Paceibacterota bacterium]
MIYNLLNSSLGTIGVISSLIMSYGIIKYSLALAKNNKKEEIKAKKISINSALILTFVAIAYSILLI